eukprot:TRINITY_DN6881_c0_g1_i1.p1 TRINITY_DN6881_c0_g1~~TRINITY_DN6881_c0_g1_i1.p1  ORF type:complete len:220 (+),score=33.27 TRINITY_DN6881_c0_g1_i1:71-661(+)
MASRATKTAIVSGGRKKIHSTLDDGSEMVEEFDVETDELLVRKVRRPNALGAFGEWVYEIGQPVKKFNPESDLLVESQQNPVFARQDTASHFQWRIRNLPYPLETYQLSVDDATQDIVLRTTNRKYFKRIAIPEMKTLRLGLQPELVQYEHQFNTLIISYPKPAPVLEKEATERRERAKLKPSQQARDGDVDCKQQ